MKLYGTLTSPYVRKVRIVMAEKKLDCEFLIEDISSANEIIQLVNPLGKVPCLIVDGNFSIYDSPIIVEHLDTMSPVARLIPANTRDRVEVKCWEALADGILDAAILVRLEEKRPEKNQNKAWVELQLNKVYAGLLAMSNKLGKQTYCHRAQYSLADIAVCCALDWISFRHPLIRWADAYPNLSALFERVSARQSFQSTVPID